MNTDSIKSILTLRYDYTQTSILPKLNWKDFEKKEDFSIEDIHKHLTSYLQKKNTRRICRTNFNFTKWGS